MEKYILHGFLINFYVGGVIVMSDLKQIELRLLELIQAIDDLRRAVEEKPRQRPIGGTSWAEYDQYG